MDKKDPELSKDRSTFIFMVKQLKQNDLPLYEDNSSLIFSGFTQLHDLQLLRSLLFDLHKLPSSSPSLCEQFMTCSTALRLLQPDTFLSISFP
jgi:hypothetical protein